MNYNLNSNKNNEKITENNSVNKLKNQNEDIFKDNNQYYYRFLK